MYNWYTEKCHFKKKPNPNSDTTGRNELTDPMPISQNTHQSNIATITHNTTASNFLKNHAGKDNTQNTQPGKNNVSIS